MIYNFTEKLDDYDLKDGDIIHVNIKIKKINCDEDGNCVPEIEEVEKIFVLNQIY